MRSMVENIACEPLNPVDQWRAIERLVLLDWTEEPVAVALALPVAKSASCGCLRMGFSRKPKKGHTASWWQIANGLSKTRLFTW